MVQAGLAGQWHPACIPGRRSRNAPVRHNKRRDGRRNRIGIMFGRLKGRHRVATPCHRCPSDFRRGRSRWQLCHSGDTGGVLARAAAAGMTSITITAPGVITRSVSSTVTMTNIASTVRTRSPPISTAGARTGRVRPVAVKAACPPAAQGPGTQASGAGVTGTTGSGTTGAGQTSTASSSGCQSENDKK